MTRKIHAELEKAGNHERWRQSMVPYRASVSRVSAAKLTTGRRVEYMTLLERDEMMREEGRREGREEGLGEAIIIFVKLLLEMDMPVEEIKDKIVTTYSISQDKAEEYLNAATSVSPAE